MRSNLKKDKSKRDTSQLLNFAQDSYLERTSRPIYALIFLLPFIIFYELGTFFINTDVLSESQIRVVAFLWLQRFLEYLGFGTRFIWAAPAFAVVIILLAIQLASRKQWRSRLSDIFPMAIESSLLAVPLIVLSLFLSGSTQEQVGVDAFNCHQILPICSSVAAEQPNLLANIVTGVGAGIYEELVFRLILISLFMLLFQDIFRMNQRNSIILSVLLSAALFSAHHHIIFIDGCFGQGVAFNWPEFCFRTLAGVYFAALFAIRGFGITAGCHAFYDIIATLINSVIFGQ